MEQSLLNKYKSNVTQKDKRGDLHRLQVLLQFCFVLLNLLNWKSSKIFNQMIKK